MFYVDQFVYSNKMRACHPLEKSVFALATMIICLASTKPLIHLLILGVMLWLLLVRAAIPGRVVLKLMSIPLSFLLIGVITVAVSFGREPLPLLVGFSLGGWQMGVTEAGLLQAGIIFLRSLSAVSCLYFLALTVPMIELIYVFQLFRVPSLLTELMMLIYRFIFVFINTAFSIYTAQSSRWGYSTFRRSINSFGVLFANLWAKAFFKSQALYNSMLSRGYENEIRVLNPAFRFSAGTMLLFLSIDLSLIIIGFLV